MTFVSWVASARPSPEPPLRSSLEALWKALSSSGVAEREITRLMDDLFDGLRQEIEAGERAW